MPLHCKPYIEPINESGGIYLAGLKDKSERAIE
jgi:hypothetical protein